MLLQAFPLVIKYCSSCHFLFVCFTLYWLRHWHFLLFVFCIVYHIYFILCSYSSMFFWFRTNILWVGRSYGGVDNNNIASKLKASTPEIQVSKDSWKRLGYTCGDYGIVAILVNIIQLPPPSRKKLFCLTNKFINNIGWVVLIYFYPIICYWTTPPKKY